MRPQPDLTLSEEHFVAPGRLVLSMVGPADLEPANGLNVAHNPLVRSPKDFLHHTNITPTLFHSTGVLEVAGVLESSLTAAVATTSPAPALLKCLTSE